MSDDNLRDIRYSRECEQNLRQFLKLETGLGNSPAFQRGYIFAFEWPQHLRDAVNKRMEEGMCFADAFDDVKSRIDELTKLVTP